VLNNLASIAYLVVGVVVGLGGIITTIVIYIKAKIKINTNQEQNTNAENDRQIARDTMDNLSKTVGALKTQNELQASQIGDSVKEIATLKGKVETLKDVPLDKIEKHMADTTQQIKTTNDILKMLVPLIPTQVEHTIIEKTTAIAQ
jgi:hypothetical protein